MLRQNRLQAIAQDKETIVTNGETHNGDSELMSAKPEPEKATKKPKPPSKKMKKLLEQQNLENQAKVQLIDNHSEQSYKKSNNVLGPFLIINILILLVLPLIMVGISLKLDSDGAKTKEFIERVFPTRCQWLIQSVMEHLRQHAINYGNWLQAFVSSKDVPSM